MSCAGLCNKLLAMYKEHRHAGMRLAMCGFRCQAAVLQAAGIGDVVWQPPRALECRVTRCGYYTPAFIQPWSMFMGVLPGNVSAAAILSVPVPLDETHSSHRGDLSTMPALGAIQHPMLVVQRTMRCITEYNAACKFCAWAAVIVVT